VKVTDLEINYIDNNITAATFGRGIWRSPLPTILATTDFMLNDIQVYPNPSQGIFNVRLGAVLPDKIEVYDVSGKLIQSNEFNLTVTDAQVNLDITNYESGIYFVKIYSEGKYTIRKIIKE
jgi:hypothetical protein